MTASTSSGSPSVHPTDGELVARVLGGDRQAYASLVRRHQQAVYRYVRGMGLDHDTSLDLVQDAFVKAYDHLAECRDGSHYRSWLFRICRNLCLDDLRNVRRQTVPISTVSDADAIEDARVEPNDLTLTLRAALDRLPEALRDAFLLKHDAGYTYDEIAALTDASPSAVKMRVHRARESLRAFLIQQGFDVAETESDGSDNRAVANRLTHEASSDHGAGLASASRAPVPSFRRIS